MPLSYVKNNFKAVVYQKAHVVKFRAHLIWKPIEAVVMKMLLLFISPELWTYALVGYLYYWKKP
jgi:hypothetical protein